MVICSQAGLVLETIGKMTMSSLSFGLFFADYNFLTLLKKGRKKVRKNDLQVLPGGENPGLQDQVDDKRR